MANNSDYNKPRLNLLNYIPEVFHSDTAKSLYENTFNRFLSKPEVNRVTGYIGEGSANAVIDREIKEPTIHRQSHQLQPILYNKIGSVEHMASWNDILNELERVGVDTERFDEWGKVRRFNWAPPIDFDKLNHYRDYYWYDADNPGSTPQYVTVRNKCNVSNAKVNFWESLIQDYGETITITNLTPSQNQILLQGRDYTSLFKEDFVFYIENSSNPDLNSTYFTVSEVDYDSSLGTNGTTIITVAEDFSDGTVSGVISLAERRDIALVERDCRCEGIVGWDLTQWDDNQISGAVIWNQSLLNDISHSTESDWISQNGSPSTYDVWYDTSSDQLKQYDGSNWVALRNSFSTIIAETQGSFLWDAAAGCESTTFNPELEQWSSQNMWLHRNEVPNFSIAKQAEIPIIEFNPDIELNAWTYTEYMWSYRSSIFNQWERTDSKPTLFEIKPITGSDYNINPDGNNANLIELDSKYGDLTDVFVEDFIFGATGVTTSFTVVDSYYKKSNNFSPFYSTYIEVDDVSQLSGFPDIIPRNTSLGDGWQGYDQHWCFKGTNGQVIPVNHQVLNPFTPIDQTSAPITVSSFTDGGEQYQYQLSEFAQLFVILESNGVPAGNELNIDPSLHGIALGADNKNLRIYLNGIRLYNDFNIFTDGNDYINKIAFEFPLDEEDEVLIELGPAAFSDWGKEEITVRTSEDETGFTTETLNLTNYYKVEQIKNNLIRNQYPLFDIYNVFGDSYNEANKIFGYHESSDAELLPAFGSRVVRDGTNYSFEQHLIEQDNGPLLAYRDYTSRNFDYWVNTRTNEVFFWHDITWSKRKDMDGYYREAIISTTEPQGTGSPNTLLDGLIWYNPSSQELFEYDKSNSLWNSVSFHDENSDPTLHTIWRTSDNGFYTPSKIDDKGRTLEQYNDEKETFIEQETNSIILTNPSFTSQQVQQEALRRWLQHDSTELRPSGEWEGDWEVPEPLIYNHMHQNRKVLDSQQLLTHFNRIINAQNQYPAFNGPKKSMFHLIDLEDVDLGIGGTIHEYNSGFDTFLSSVFVKNTTPPSLIEFAQNQYENKLVQLKEIFRSDYLNEQLVTFNNDVLNDFSSGIPTNVISDYEQNANQNIIYGDSTTYSEQTTQGVRNWIATLPYFGIVDKHRPYKLVDNKLDINEVVHHDSHRENYSLTNATLESVIQQTISTNDHRVNNEKYGQVSSSLPPNNITEFQNQISSNIRTGLYWYYVNDNRVLYRFSVVSVGTSQPSLAYDDGSLWLDTTPGSEVLRIKDGLNWNVVSGLNVGDGRLHNGSDPSDTTTATVSAWKTININETIADIILEVEQRLYNNLPEVVDQSINFDRIENDYPQLFEQYIEEAFYNHVHDLEIVSPLASQGHYQSVDPFTWNYKHSTINSYPSSSNTGNETGGDWRDLYEKIYGTPYPHLEPWKLQGYENKPEWWDSEYLNDDPVTYGNRRWKYIHNPNQSSTPYGTGMWENIRTAVVPTGYQYPDGTLSSGTPQENSNIPTYTYFSVNISNGNISSDGGTTVYESDDLLPPFWDHTQEPSLGNSPAQSDISIRSVFDDFNNQIITPGADYRFGDMGPIEWEWRKGSQFLYDQLEVSYRIEPVYTITKVFGVDIIETGLLEIDARTEKTFAHNRTIFHGDLIDSNDTFEAEGINQWYVNFNRFAGFDSNYSDFNQLWTQWTAPMMYQFASFLDTTSLSVRNDNIVVSEFDYDITIKRSSGVNDYWVNSFDITVTDIPPSIISFNNQNEWEFHVDTQSPIGQNIKYYGVNQFDFYADENTNICTLYKYPIVNADSSNDTVSLRGDLTNIFQQDRTFTITNSTGNNGSFTVDNTTYDSVSNNTIISVIGNISTNNSDGFVVADYKTIPWETGDIVYFSSEQVLPIPLDSSLQYFIIKVDDTQFKIARTPSDATLDNEINLMSSGTGYHYVGSATSTFNALNGQTTGQEWRHFSLDKDTINTITPPFQIRGIQNLINIIDGYAEYIKDQGFVINNDGELFDPQTNRLQGWQVEIERLIDWLYNLRRVRHQAQNNSYEVNVNQSTNVWTFTGQQIPSFITGQRIRVSASAAFPTPIIPGTDYHIIRDSQTEFRLAATKADANSGTEIDITSTTNVNDLFIYESNPFNLTQNYTFEVNPFRGGIWFSPESGIVSNVRTGPYEDIRSQQTLFDQNGNKLSSDNVNVFREDKLTQISVDEIANEKQIPIVGNDPYSNIHLAGAHLFTDNYEHVLKFNNYNSEDFLLYDPFIGLYATKYDLSFFRQNEFTQRPNVGGHYLTKQFNQGGELKRNIEASISDIRRYYDTYTLPETINVADFSRELLGYEGSRSYLDNIGLNEKSQFVFWRGLIQSKGSTNAMNAFINSRRFIDANMDEFWAVKVAEFGSTNEKEYPELFLVDDDSQETNIKLHFISENQTPDPDYTGISLTNQDRWFKQPKQEQILNDNDNRMKFTLKPYHKDTLDNLDTFDTGNIRTIRHNFKADAVLITYTNNNGDKQYIDPNDITYISTDVVNVDLTGYTVTGNNQLTIWGLNVDKEAQNPAKVIDKNSQIVLTPITTWDPARGQHYYQAISKVDIINDTDPANYNNASTSTGNSDAYWNEPEVGTIWLDNSNMFYKPYYEEQAYSSIDERIEDWGDLADFGSIDVYQWVKSDVPPSEWEGDGTPKRILMEDFPAGSPVVFTEFDVYHESFDVYFDSIKSSPTVTNTSGNDWEITTSIPQDVDVSLFINGNKIEELTVSAGGIVSFTYQLNNRDRIDIVRNLPTEQEIEQSETYHYVYDYSLDVSYDQFNNPINNYYFWVKDKLVNDYGNVSIATIKNQLIKTPEPFMTFSGIGTTNITLPTNDTVNDVPSFFEKVLINGLRGRIDGERRYTIRFTRDYTLRDALDDTKFNGNTSLKKNLHNEWELFREDQLFNIRRDLWDKLIEAMIGYKLDDDTIRVPSLERELYDETYQTDTQYGLGNEQAFTHGETAIETVRSYLTDPNVDFYPINIDTFLNNNTFDTNDDIISTMNNIYNSFPFQHVNRIFFLVLYDALSFKKQHSEIFKTSMVALHGIKILETQGLFDD